MSERGSEGRCYLGVGACGHATFIAFDNGDDPDTVKMLAEVLDSGRQIEIVPVTEGKERLTSKCRCDSAVEPSRIATLAAKAIVARMRDLSATTATGPKAKRSEATSTENSENPDRGVST